MRDLLDALGVASVWRRRLTAVAIWVAFAGAMVGVAAAQAVLERVVGSGAPAIIAAVIMVWLGWTWWHSVLFLRHRVRYLECERLPYRRAFFTDIFPGITIGFSQMLRPVWNGENLAAGRIFPHLPQGGFDTVAVVAGWVVAAGAFLLFAAAWRTLGAARAGFVSEFVDPIAFVPLRCGPYRRVRHPLFWSGIAVSWAGALLSGTAIAASIALLNTGYGLAYNRLEDRRMISVFGDRYCRYARDVPSIVPARQADRKRKDAIGLQRVR